ncbi:MAG: hypothetical protein AAF383_13325 [Cyanobacteria bacterium P01_A01_bin.83]
MSLSFCWTTVACSGTPNSVQTQPNFNNNATVPAAPTSISDGKYPVQQATYDDVSGEYSLMLLNTPAGSPPVLQTAQLQMARISEEEVANGERTYLQVENGQPVWFKILDYWSLKVLVFKISLNYSKFRLSLYQLANFSCQKQRRHYQDNYPRNNRRNYRNQGINNIS